MLGLAQAATLILLEKHLAFNKHIIAHPSKWLCLVRLHGSSEATYLPHLTVSLRPLMISLLKDFSAAISAACRVANWMKAHCCLWTIVMVRISPNW